jgi:GT2 family glycosyltransferase
MDVDLLPASVVLATRNRTPVLRRALQSLSAQSAQPAELVIVDASDDNSTRELCLYQKDSGLGSIISWCSAEMRGAASQRNQGVRMCRQTVIGFIDDDVLFEPHCFTRLWSALQSDPRLGGVNAMIANQRYCEPGRASRFIFQLMAGRPERSYAGRVLGPAVNLLPEDRDDLPEVVPVEWLNTTCTLYRREALPNPAFPAHFQGYSLMEDVALSLTVGKKWKLANARTARIFHDSQPGSHKSDAEAVAHMHLLNRHYVMTQVLRRTRPIDYVRLLIWLAFSHLSTAITARNWSVQVASLRGELRAIGAMIAQRELAHR